MSTTPYNLLTRVSGGRLPAFPSLMTSNHSPSFPPLPSRIFAGDFIPRSLKRTLGADLSTRTLHDIHAPLAPKTSGLESTHSNTLSRELSVVSYGFRLHRLPAQLRSIAYSKPNYHMSDLDVLGIA